MKLVHYGGRLKFATAKAQNPLWWRRDQGSLWRKPKICYDCEGIKPEIHYSEKGIKARKGESLRSTMAEKGSRPAMVEKGSKPGMAKARDPLWRKRKGTLRHKPQIYYDEEAKLNMPGAYEFGNLSHAKSTTTKKLGEMCSSRVS
ncbi:hypothetical protein BHE74_00027058 [Ensete ventricosum]|nr:hypothetical protein BHE74_00027058 [Ensete ventricosum]RZR90450.1 hypothetical protein BHM03_00018336 [Ensete ventricosum]